MKNIFKLMGIALMSCSLMVACGDKDNDNTPDNPTPNPGDNTPSFTLNFDGATWSPASTIFTHTSQQGSTIEGAQPYMILYGFKSANDAQALIGGSNPSDAYVSGTLMCVVGSFTNQSSGGDYISYSDPNATVYWEGDENNEAGNYYQWQAQRSSFTENITAVDLTARTISAVFTCDHFKMENYIANNGTSYGELYTLTGTMSNYSWTWIEDQQ